MNPARDGRLWPIAWVCAAALAAGVLLQRAGHVPARGSAGSGADPGASAAGSIASNPSKYGVLTSARWAYGATYQRADLVPTKNPNPHPEPQPHRDHPFGLALTADGKKAYVSLSGSESQPGHEVAVFDVQGRRVTRRIRVGARPSELVLHPGGRLLFVLNLYSNYASVIDTERDQVVSEVPLDYYCVSLAFNRAGTIGYVSSRYLDQILVLDVDPARATAAVRPLGGFDEAAFLKPAPSGRNLHQILRAACGAANCHARDRGGFYAGDSPLKAFFSALDHSVAGEPDDSVLLSAITSTAEGGFADARASSNFHAGGRVVWRRADPDYQAVAAWIRAARVGPGIPVENFESKPGHLALSSDERLLYVGNQGSQSISVIDTARLEEITAIYTQNLITDLRVFRDPRDPPRELLIASSLGAGFGAPKERDPYGGETSDPAHPAAQFSVERDPATAEALPLSQQVVLGPFDGVDGTAAFKMGDIQNDLLVIDTARVRAPARQPGRPQQYALSVNRYQAHDAWVRYTSDSAEVLAHDVKGDIPPELQRVIGAFPESIDLAGDRAFVAMLGSAQLTEYRVSAHPGEPSDVLEPVAVYPTGIMPRRVRVGPAGTGAAGLLFVTNFLGETLSVIDTRSGQATEYPVGDLSRPFPDTNAERGDVFVNTALFSADGDTACMSCHIYGTSDGRGWGAGQAIAQTRDGRFVSGGMLGIPQLRNLYPIQPFYFEGTHTVFDAQLDDAREHVALHAFLQKNPQGDFTGLVHPRPPREHAPEHEEVQDKMSLALFGDKLHDLEERRDEEVRRLTMRHFGKAFDFRDLQRFIGEYQAAESRLPPNPFDQQNPSVQRGRLLFNDLSVGCVSCHKPPHFADKDEALTHNQNRALPALISFTPRELTFTLMSPSWMDKINGYKRDLEPWEEGRWELKQGFLTTFQLRGMFDRPGAFLHHGKALTVRETFAAPNHYSLRRFKYSPLRGGEEVRPDGRERGFNELMFPKEKTYMVDTHGATSHLNARQVRDLEAFLRALE